MPKIFKTCPYCKITWDRQHVFLSDPNIEIIGYTAHFKKLEEGLFFFCHKTCETTLTVKTGGFKNLYDGPIYNESMTGTSECPSYCLFKDNLQPCKAKCECAYVRDVIQIIKNWPKH